jgi:hypothetical protein
MKTATIGKLLKALLVLSFICAAPVLAVDDPWHLYEKTGKTTLIDTDLFGIEDSAAAWAVKHVTFANLKISLKAEFYTETEINAMFVIESSGFDGNLNAGHDTFQEIAQALDDLPPASDEVVQDIAGGMVTGNTETGLSVTYDDGTGKLNFVIGTLNQNTTGSAASLAAQYIDWSAASGGSSIANKPTTSALGLSLLAAVDAAAGQTALSLVPGTDVQEYSENLLDWAALATTDKQDVDDDLTDLADGSLTGSKIGTGINGDYITTGTVIDTVIDSSILRDSEAAAAYQPLHQILTDISATTATAYGIGLLESESAEDFISTAGLEPSLGNPGTNGYILASTTEGVRSWVANGSLASLPTADNQALIATGSGTYEWTSDLSPWINDSAGNGATSSLWSADKIFDELALKQASDADLTDLADGSLTGSKVGTGIDGTNITAGTISEARISSAITRDTEAAAAYQPLDSDLTALAALSTTTVGRSILDDASQGAMLVTIGAEPDLGDPTTTGYILSSTSAGVRSWVANSAMASLPTADNQVMQATGVGTYAWVDTLEGIINDTAGDGDADAIWSADKTFDMLAGKQDADGDLLAIAALSTTALGRGILNDATQAEMLITVGAEAALGNPSVTGYVLSSTNAGTRSWVQNLALSSLPTASNQIMQATGVGTYIWTSSMEGIIDDTAGNGDDDALWSADHTFDLLAGKEPSLGNPGTTGYVLSSTDAGVRSWVANGGSVDDASITTTDVTTNNASTTKHGWMLKAVAPASGLINVAGIGNGETIYSMKPLFDATDPSTQAPGDSAAVGSATVTARRDHKHNMSGFAATSGNTFTGVQDFTSATSRMASGTSPPGTCATGDYFWDTDADTDGSLYVCRTTNTWKEVDDDGGAGGMTTADIDTSSELRNIVTDESGTGALIFAGGDIAAATATTPAANDNDTSVATTAYTQSEFTAYASDSKTFTNVTMDYAGTGNSITVPYELPTTVLAPADADDPLIDKANRAVTLVGVDCVALGGGTISIDIQECDANGANCATTGATIASCGATNTNDASLTNTSIDSGDWIKLVLGAPSGTVNQVAIKLYGTQIW